MLKQFFKIAVFCVPLPLWAGPEVSNIDQPVTCNGVFVEYKTQWEPYFGATSINLPVAKLIENGAAHVGIPLDRIKPFASASPEEVGSENVESEVERQRAYQELGDYLLSKLRADLPDLQITAITGLHFFRRFDPRRRNLNRNPSTNIPWHYDTPSFQQDAPTLRNLEGNHSVGFKIRATVVAPVDIFPPTLVIPPLGPYTGIPVQGIGSVVTLFIMDITKHSPDYTYGDVGRGLENWDFHAIRR